MMTLLVNSLLDGDQAKSIREARKLLDADIDPQRIITNGVEAAMARLDAKCTVAQFNLLEIMLCGRAAMGVMKEVYPPENPPPRTKGTVVLGALEGDVHDLGKNIFKMVLTASEYRVVDCGKDCPLERLIETAAQEAALAVGISGLITTVIPQVLQIRDRMLARGLDRIKVMAGGAALKQGSTESLKVDFVAQTAFDGLRYLERIHGDAR